MRLALCVLTAFALAAPATLAGAEPDPIMEEPAAAAMGMLQKFREKVGDLERFEAEFWIVDLDHAFQGEKRGRGHIYFESPSGAIMEFRSIDIPQKQSQHRDPSGHVRTYTLETIPSTTLFWKNATLTITDEGAHTYSIQKLESAGTPLGTWTGFFYPFLHPRCCLPVWLDPEIELERVKSRYRFVDGKSNASAFAFRMVQIECRDPIVQWDWCDRGAFDYDHILLFDRRTSLPTRWTVRTGPFASERTFVFTRFDLAPPHRELKLDLKGYRNQDGSANKQTSAGK
jgi:hypothetical protein